MNASEPDDATWDDLVDRLSLHGVRYLMGGGIGKIEDAPVPPLLLDLARTRHSRLRDALIALLLSNPGVDQSAEQVARSLPPGDPARRFLLVSLVVAAALQEEWRFSLDLYLPGQSVIDAQRLAAELGLPNPHEDFGRPCIAAASELLRRDAPFPYNYRAGWEDTVHRLLQQLIQEARRARA